MIYNKENSIILYLLFTQLKKYKYLAFYKLILLLTFKKENIQGSIKWIQKTPQTFFGIFWPKLYILPIF